MDFSETYRTSGPPPAYSPNGRYLATVVDYRLIIRDVETLAVVQLYSCLDRISRVDWCRNSTYVLCGLYARGVLQVWSVHEPAWTCKIDEGPAGVQSARWAPDGLSVVVVADFQIRTTVWSLADRKCTYMRGPKHADDASVVFSADGRCMAVLERADLKDRVSVYECGGDWRQVGDFALATSDAAGLAWSPDGRHLAAWDSCLAYRVAVHTVPDGRAVACYSAVYGGDQATLGVKAVAWGPSGTLLAVGSYDQACRVLNNVTWQPLLECQHPASVQGPASVVVYQEAPEDGPHEAATGNGGRSPAKALGPAADQGQGKTKFVICDLPAAVATVKPALDRPGPKLGVGTVSWSPDGQYLATVNDNMPGAVWVWELATMELCSVVMTMAPVRAAKWAPQGCMLAVVTGGGKLYLWAPAGASVVHIPLTSFQAHGLQWAPPQLPHGPGAADVPSGASNFVLLDREAFCLAYLAGG